MMPMMRGPAPNFPPVNTNGDSLTNPNAPGGMQGQDDPRIQAMIQALMQQRMGQEQGMNQMASPLMGGMGY